MVPTTFSLALLFLVGPAWAGPAPQTRTLQELVDLALKEGRDKAIPPNMAEHLGLGKVQIPVKRLRCSSKNSPDGKEHTFDVIVNHRDVEESEPRVVVLATVKAKKKKDAIELDATQFLMGVTGDLQSAFRGSGMLPEIELKPLPVKSRAIRKQFEEEKSFHTAKMIRLGLVYD